MLSIVVAMDLRNGIGVDDKLLCHLPNDLKNFKEITTGHTVIMGRKTYDSLPPKFKPLPNRKNIVISRTVTNISGCTVLNSIENVKKYIDDDKEYFVIGGEEIYRQLLPYTQKIYLTSIKNTFAEANVFFPNMYCSDWELEIYVSHTKDDKHTYDYSFEKYHRIN